MPLSPEKDFWEAMRPHLDRLPEEQRQQAVDAIRKQRKRQRTAEYKQRKREEAWDS